MLSGVVKLKPRRCRSAKAYIRAVQGALKAKAYQGWMNPFGGAGAHDLWTRAYGTPLLQAQLLAFGGILGCSRDCSFNPCSALGGACRGVW